MYQVIWILKKEKGLDYNECDGNNEDDENDNGKDADDDYVDIYIMMKCLSVCL